MRDADPEAVAALFDAAERCLRRERRRTDDELEALGAFEDELRGTPTESAPVENGALAVSTTGHGGAGGGLRAVREAYEATVMSVPHYAEEYGDTYAESLAEEFGPDVATALTRRTAFDERSKRATLSAVSEAKTRRERLESALAAEAESLRTVRPRLLETAREVEEFATAPLAELPFETLDAYRARLSVLADRCDDLAAARQSTLDERRRSLWLPVEGPDFAAYVYRDLDVDHPVLAAVAAVASRVEETQRAVERAVGYCN